MRAALLLLLVALAVAFAPAPHGARAGSPPRWDWDAARDFSTTANPNGVWSYGETASDDDAADFVPAAGLGPGRFPGTVAWQGVGPITSPDGHRGVPAEVACNTSGRDLRLNAAAEARDTDIASLLGLRDGTWRAGTISLHASTERRRAVVRFTAPAAGRYTVSVRFRRLEPASVARLYVLVNGVSLWEGAVAPAPPNGGSVGAASLPAEPLFTETLPLRAGATLDTTVGGTAGVTLVGADVRVRRAGPAPDPLPPGPWNLPAATPEMLAHADATRRAIEEAERRGDWREQYRLLEEGLAWSRRVGLPRSAALCLWELIYRDGLRHDLTDEARHLAEVMAVEDACGDREHGADARDLLATRYLAQGRRAEARRLFLAADAQRETRGEFERGMVAAEQGKRWDVWMPFHELLGSNLRHYTVLGSAPTWPDGEPGHVVGALIYRADRLELLGFPERSIAMNEAAFRMNQRNGVGYPMNGCLTALIRLNARMGRFAEAHAWLDTPPPPGGGNRQPWTVACLRGDLYAGEGRWAEARTAFDDAYRQLAPVVVGLRVADWEAVRDEAARRNAERIRTGKMPEATPSGLRYDYYKLDLTNIWRGQAAVAAAEGRTEEAMRLLANALATYAVDGPEREKTLTAWEVGRRFEAEGDAPLAYYWYRRTRTWLTRTFAHPAEWVDIEIDCARAAEAVGRFAEAEDDYRAAAGITSEMVRRSETPFQVSGFYTGANPWAAWAAFRLRRGDTPETALLLLERGRADWLTALGGGSDPGAAERRLSAQDAADWAARRRDLAIAGQRLRAAALDPNVTDAAFAEEAGRCREVRARVDLFENYLRTHYPGFKALGVPPPTPTDRAALVRANPDALFLDYAVVDEHTTLCFAFGAGSPVRAFVLPLGRSALETRVARWRAALLGGTLLAARQETTQADALYCDLLGPVERAGLLAANRVRRLVLLSDGPLRDLPFAALCDGAGRRLIKRLPLSGALALSALNSRPGGPPRGAASLLCAVDPLAPGKAAVRVAATSPAPAAGTTAATATVRELRRGYQPLQGARAEADSLLALYPNGLRLQGEAATEARVKGEAPGRDILHFATHATVDRSSALDSWLLLAADREGREDGRLEAREVTRMTLTARLAVLSACETGVARPGQGGGLLGFAWAFRAAGCPSVVASLWSVDDAATSRLMAAFYAGLKAGQPKDEALRAAMLLLARGGERTKRPYYWAAWQVVGDAAPLAPAGARR